MAETQEHKKEIFATTRWTIVLQAGGADTALARDALETLCHFYWAPLYAYVRRRGYNPHDAEDLTQGFFTRLLRLNSIALADREKGKFRAFLLAAMKHFLADEWDRASALKRSAQLTLSLDAEIAERGYLSEPADHLSPDRLYERRWALTLLQRVVDRLSREYESAGQGAFFQEARFAITGDKNSLPYTELARQLALSEEALRSAVHRLRQRYRRLLREEIAQTLAPPAQVDEELAELRRILSEPGPA